MKKLEPNHPIALREIYLAEVSRQLQNRLSSVEVYDSVLEMRAHIDAMSDAYEELGMEPTEAMRLAVARFGSAKSVTSDLPSKERITGSRDTFHQLIPTAIILSLTGFMFAAIIRQVVTRWFASYIGEFPGTTIYRAGDPMMFMLKVYFELGIAFQIPLIAYLLNRFDMLNTSSAVKHGRLWIASLVALTLVVSPSKDLASMVLVAAALVVLFAFSALLIKISASIHQVLKPKRS